MNFTVIGGLGFIGSAVVERLRLYGYDVFVPGRDDSNLLKYKHGHIIYAAGVTADFRSRPFDTIRAHITTLNEILEYAQFDSLLYLSSARIYRHAQMTQEDSQILILSEDMESFYDLTKLTGEAICHASGRKNVRVARLTNVVGKDYSHCNFLFDLIYSACSKGSIELRSCLDSEKDYITVDDVVGLLIKIATQGRRNCYNVGSGLNIPHSEILNQIASQINIEVTVADMSPKIVHQLIDISRIKDEFEFKPRSVLLEIPKIVNEYRRNYDVKNRS